MPANRCCALLLALLFVAPSIASAAPPGDEQASFVAPSEAASALSALVRAFEDAGAPPEVPTLEEMRARAEARLLELARPDRLAALLDALERGETLSLSDTLVTGAILRSAAPGAARTPLGERAAQALADATGLRSTRGLAPGGLAAASAHESGVGPVSGIPFGPLRLLGVHDRPLREERLTVETSRLLEREVVHERIHSESRSATHRDVYLWTFESSWIAYTAYASFYERHSESLRTGLVSVERLFSLHETFDEWRFTSGVSVQVLEQRAPVPASASGRMLYTVATPYTYLDHWWAVLAVESLYHEIRRTLERSRADEWEENLDGDATRRESSGSQSETWVLAFGYHSILRRSGSFALPAPRPTMLRALSIEFLIPLHEMPPLPRSPAPFDLSTAAQMTLPGVTGIHHRDRKASEALLVTPELSGFGLVADAGEARRAGGAMASQATDAIDDRPVEIFERARRIGDEALALALSAASGSPPAAGAPPSPGGDAGGIPPRLSLTFESTALRAWQRAGAGVGVLVPEVEGTRSVSSINVRVSALGLGSPVAFEIRREGTALLARTPTEAATQRGLSDVASDPPAASPWALVEPALPVEASFPAYLAGLGVSRSAGGLRAAETSAKTLLLSAPAAAFERTLHRLSSRSAEHPIPAEDWTRLHALLYLAGPGHADDPPAGDRARALLHASIASWLVATHADGNDQGNSDAPAPVPAPEDLLAGLVSVPLTDPEVVAHDVQVLRHDTHVESHREERSRTAIREELRVSRLESVERLETTRQLEYWRAYHAKLLDARSEGERSWSAEIEEASSLLLQHSRIDVVEGVYTVLLDLHAENAAGLRADALYTIVLPFAFRSSGWLEILLDEYRHAHLREHETWRIRYHESVLDGSAVIETESDAGNERTQGLHVETRLTVRGRTLLVPVPDVAVAPDASILYQIPLEGHLLLPRRGAFNGAPFAGVVPDQPRPLEEAEALAAAFVIGPAPNAYAAEADDDAILDPADRGAAQGESDAIQSAEGALDTGEAAAHDPTGAARRAIPERLPIPEPPSPDDVRPPDAPRPVAGAHSIRFETPALIAYRPAAVVVGVLTPPDDHTRERDPITITLAGRGLSGNGALGATDAFHAHLSFRPPAAALPGGAAG